MTDDVLTSRPEPEGDDQEAATDVAEPVTDEADLEDAGDLDEDDE